MSRIVLSTLNAKYIHTAFGLRCLRANLGGLRERSLIAEFDIKQRPLDIAARLLELDPAILGLGVYVWNVAPVTELVAILKRVRPELPVILGGPEVSFEQDPPSVAALADYVVAGEGDLRFAALCREILEGRPPAARFLPGGFPRFEEMAWPYDEYTDDDIARRIVYVEGARGCPYGCEFCLSSLDVPIRRAPLAPFLEQLGRLLDRGATHLKFVDRTFNAHPPSAAAVLEYLLARARPGILFHFEATPDRFPADLAALASQFPPGMLQFEVGVQSFDETVLNRIGRRSAGAAADEALLKLRRETGAHIHADLVAGLPGESLEGFAAGFDRLVALDPQEIQVGILKRLRGAPIARHDAQWGMVYNPNPPYDILKNGLLDFPTVQRLRRFARYWELVGNSGNFAGTRRAILDAPTGDPPRSSPFRAFLRCSDWLHARAGRADSIALHHLAELLFDYLCAELGRAPQAAADLLWSDYQRAGRREKPAFMRPFIPDRAAGPAAPAHPKGPARQARHQTPAG